MSTRIVGVGENANEVLRRIDEARAAFPFDTDLLTKEELGEIRTMFACVEMWVVMHVCKTQGKTVNENDEEETEE